MKILKTNANKKKKKKTKKFSQNFLRPSKEAILYDYQNIR